MGLTVVGHRRLTLPNLREALLRLRRLVELLLVVDDVGAIFGINLRLGVHVHVGAKHCSVALQGPVQLFFSLLAVTSQVLASRSEFIIELITALLLRVDLLLLDLQLALEDRARLVLLSRRNRDPGEKAIRVRHVGVRASCSHGSLRSRPHIGLAEDLVLRVQRAHDNDHPVDRGRLLPDEQGRALKGVGHVRVVDVHGFHHSGKHIGQVLLDGRVSTDLEASDMTAVKAPEGPLETALHPGESHDRVVDRRHDELVPLHALVVEVLVASH